MSVSIDGSGSITGISSLSNPSEIIVGTGASIIAPATNELSIETNGAERIRVGAAGSMGIGTVDPRSILHVRTTDATVTLEGTRGSGHKYRVETTGLNAEGINIYDDATNQRAWLYYAGVDPSTQSYQEFSTNGTVRQRINNTGIITKPYQPSAVWIINADISTYVRSLSIKRNIGNHLASTPAGNGSTHGSVGRFTAPVDGAYLIAIFTTGVPASSNGLLSLYGSWSTTTNALTPGSEVLDFRTTRPPQDGGGWSQVFYFSANDYWEIDWYRVAPTSYVDASVIVISAHLLG